MKKEFTEPYVLSNMPIPQMYFPMQQPNGEFYPKQHKVESYRSQQRAAKKRRNVK